MKILEAVTWIGVVLAAASCGQHSNIHSPDQIAGPQGLAGEPGQAGETGTNAVLETIDPCGDGPGFDEVILRLNDGTLIAYFEVGGKRFLTILSEGNYRTTDAQRCRFSVDSEGNVTF